MELKTPDAHSYREMNTLIAILEACFITAISIGSVLLAQNMPVHGHGILLRGYTGWIVLRLEKRKWD